MSYCSSSILGRREMRPGRKLAASSAREKLRDSSGRPMKKGRSKPLTLEQQAELDVLAALPEEQIDTRDMPEIREWSGARRGALYRPVKRQITLRIDADVIEWFRLRRRKGEGYQTSINRALREYVEQHRREPKESSGRNARADE